MLDFSEQYRRFVRNSQKFFIAGNILSTSKKLWQEKEQIHYTAREETQTQY